MTDWADVADQAVHVHRALQKQAELAELLALAAERDVRAVLEIGSDAGGTLWAWRQLGAEVIAVTLLDGPFSSRRPLTPHGATVIAGDSHRLDTWLAVDRLLPTTAGVDMLFIDGDHTPEGVEQDVAAYSRFVRPGGLVVLHDICPHPKCPEIGVHEVWRDLSTLPSAWEIIDPPAQGFGIGVIERIYA